MRIILGLGIVSLLSLTGCATAGAFARGYAATYSASNHRTVDCSAINLGNGLTSISCD